MMSRVSVLFPDLSVIELNTEMMSLDFGVVTSVLHGIVDTPFGPVSAALRRSVLPGTEAARGAAVYLSGACRVARTSPKTEPNSAGLVM